MSEFQDARTIPPDTVLTTDVCVIGAGAAGITIARDLAGSRHDVYVVESGDVDLDASTQDLASGETIGHPYASLASTRLRYFGGSTNHWAGWCSPLNAVDFAERDWVPASGWPIALADLVPYYERAQQTNELAAFTYDVDAWSSRSHPEARLGDDVETVIWQFSPPTRYGAVYRDALARAANVHVLLNANLTAFETTQGADHVNAVTLTTLEGTSFKLVARQFVLATGGIENARLLLLADDVEAGGLGNANDLVGRYFMEHPHVTTASCVFADPEKDVNLYASRAPRRAFGGRSFVTRIEDRLRRTVDALPPLVSVRGGLRLSDAVQRREGVLNGGAVLRRFDVTDDLTVDVQRVIAATAPEQEGSVSAYAIRLQLEQAPNPDSRVTLSDERDGLGLRRPRLDWRLTDLDTHTLVTTTHALGRALGLSGEGRLRFEAWVLEEAGSWEAMYGGNHHMGTTRMSDDPRRGVVDRNCRVHSVDNLFIAGSSVFPTGGFVNPTLTLTALAHRLADHVRETLDRG
jgi:choline dehydrogenase-like flavoprotein